MNQNLVLLPPDEKQKIEIDKQASFAVWQVKKGTENRQFLFNQTQAQTVGEMRAYFQQCVEKYSQIMGI
ncbi:DUF3283 family protein [Candidatus Enterovibrio escicola]|uniref:Pyridoxamine 5'-phosphate oxidase n=1 Tax=Candidatus Enterovibrio escicola TaxID=1927127 RepID=A0A2A5T4K5_9GAMM|nr:DUF3283 family protein [Candidatus Enterovibrio escacola]PCS23084.1 hypothetical protein BTN49_1077 [Candidatus Enterovibrio escacola]